MTKFTHYNAADYLKSDEAITAYLDEALRLGDPAGVKQALGNIARAQTIQKVADRAGMKRESLSRAVSVHGNPELDTFLKITKAMGVQLGARSIGGPVKVNIKLPAKDLGVRRNRVREKPTYVKAPYEGSRRGAGKENVKITGKGKDSAPVPRTVSAAKKASRTRAAR